MSNGTMDCLVGQCMFTDACMSVYVRIYLHTYVCIVVYTCAHTDMFACNRARMEVYCTYVCILVWRGGGGGGGNYGWIKGKSVLTFVM